MAFGGTITRRPRFDTRRFRKVHPHGPNQEEQAKLIGSHSSRGDAENFGKSRTALRAMMECGEARNPDMTPVARLAAGSPVRFYLAGRTIIASAVLADDAEGRGRNTSAPGDRVFRAPKAREERSDDAFDDFFAQNEDLPLFSGDPRKRHGDPSKGRFRRAKLRLRRRNARRRAGLNNWGSALLCPKPRRNGTPPGVRQYGFVERTLPEDLPDGITVQYAS